MPDNQSRIEAAYNYNRDLVNGLQEIFDELNKGQTKKVLKNEFVKNLVEKYRIRTKED